MTLPPVNHRVRPVRLSDVSGAIPGAVCHGDPSMLVHGVCHDSRAAAPGYLFGCLVGLSDDGHRFAADAVARGAVALLVRSDRVTEFKARIPVIAVPDTRSALPMAAACVYGSPSKGLMLVGATGTNGKTTSVMMLASVLRTAGHCVGTIGTLGAELNGQDLPSARTTPEADQLQALLARMRADGASAVAMEVSSHALEQCRTDCCEFDAAIFTNLTRDHLDYHGDLEAYFGAKLRLFTEYPRKSGKRFVAAVNLDDPWGARVVEAAEGRVVTFAIGARADIRAVDVAVTPGSVAFSATSPVGPLSIRLPIGGAFQTANALGVIAACIGLGIPTSAIVVGLQTMPSVPGRFETVPNDRGVSVIVDYAHSPDGVENLLISARRLEPSRVIIMLGAGGNRDKAKRPLMSAIACRLADVVILTSDNPRNEEPLDIIEDMKRGLDPGAAQIAIEPDRRAAIELAIREARPGDLVLLAGKGHEIGQEVAGRVFPFDDRVVAREVLRSLA